MSSDIRLDTASVSVDQLLARVRSGEIRVPEFQRSFTWRRPDVQKLIDSVHKSFPIGTLLVWKKPGPAERLRLGGLSFDAHASENVWWVVDGQQRVTSLANLLMLASAERPFNVAFDVEKGSWSVPRAETLALSTAVDSEGLLEWLAARSLSVDARKRAIQLGARLKEYRVPVWVVETSDESAIREIFGRLNSLGKKLKPEQIFEALEKKPATSLSAVAHHLSALGFGKLDNKVIHKTLLAFQGHDFTSDRVGRSKSDESYASVEQGLSSAIVFLREHGVPHLKLLPYSFALLFLGAFFARNPSPHPRNRELLSRWFWRSTVSGQLAGSDRMWVRTILKSLALDESATVQSWLRASGLPKLDGTLSAFNLTSAATRLDALAMLSLASREVVERVASELDAGRSPFRELIPFQRAAKKRRSEGQPFKVEFATSIVMRVVMLDERLVQTELLPLQAAFVTAFSEEHEDVWQRGDELAKRFVELRHRFLASRIKPDENDRPPLESLTLGDEDTDAA